MSCMMTIENTAKDNKNVLKWSNANQSSLNNSQIWKILIKRNGCIKWTRAKCQIKRYLGIEFSEWACKWWSMQHKFQTSVGLKLNSHWILFNSVYQTIENTAKDNKDVLKWSNANQSSLNNSQIWKILTKRDASNLSNDTHLKFYKVH